MKYSKLLQPLLHRGFSLDNRIVMAPMNRRRAFDGIPSASMIEYYRQRSSAGLLITDNTLISSNAGEYTDTPGIFSDAQKGAWRRIVEAVHAEGGTIFVQLVHGGRVGHSAIQGGEPLIAPSAIAVRETISLPDGSYQPMTMPVAIGTGEIGYWVQQFVKASVDAIEVGFDGVEIHAAHGFLIDQFVNPASNVREDEYGGTIAGRARFLVDVMRAVVSAIGPLRTGIRLSPFRELYDLKDYPSETDTHWHILDELERLGILYIHYSNVLIDGQPTVSAEYLTEVRRRFSHLLMIAGGFEPATAEEVLASGLVDMVAFGKLFISNPDLVERVRLDAPLSAWKEETFYRGGDEGYIDYARLIR